MNAIIKFFSSFIDIIVSIFNLLLTLIEGVIWFITNLPALIAGISSSFAFTPSFLLPFLTVSVSLMVVLFVIRLL